MLPSNPLKRKSNDASDIVHTCGHTELEQEFYSFLWSVKNFNSIPESGDIKSPIFNGGTKHSWQLKLHPKQKLGNIDCLSVYLILVDYGDKNQAPGSIVNARFRITILNADYVATKQLGSRRKLCEFKKGSDLGGKLIPSSDVYLPTEGVLIGNAIKIHCKIWIDGELKHNVSSGSSLAAKRMYLHLDHDTKTQRKNELAADFGRIFRESVMSDVQISTADKCFQAHKAVLAGRSTVFAAMLTADMTEKQESNIQISDFDDDVVSGMLQYLYTGETILIGKRAPDLLRIADKYDVPGLKQDCEHAIADKLTVDNAAETLTLAHMHNATVLKQCVLEYVNRNAAKVKQTKGFENLQFAHPQILLDLYLWQVDNDG